jgi:uncharacterized cofD-like protein
MKKVVTIGGGTGQYNLLSGLKNYDFDLTAIVNVVDSGGSSGKLRVEFGILPPGDIRNCLVALSDDSHVKDLADLFSYRFVNDQDGGLNHNLGNLILTALSKKYGDMAQATKVAGSLLNIKGNVLPVSIDKTHLGAEFDSGEKIVGEDKITSCSKSLGKIKNVFLEPSAYIYKDSAKAIRDADLIVICAGEIYGSIIPNFLVKGFKEAIMDSKAKIVYVCNLVTKQGTYGFKASDFVSEIEKYLEREVDFIICNTKKPTQKIVDKYLAEESFFVECDMDSLKIIKEDLLVEFEVGNLITARHDADKVSRIIMDLLN